jgi:hypothetical protein
MKKHGVPHKDALSYFEAMEVNQVLKKTHPKKKIQKEMYKIDAWPYSFQIDIIIMPQYRATRARLFSCSWPTCCRAKHSDTHCVAAQ